MRSLALFHLMVLMSFACSASSSNSDGSATDATPEDANLAKDASEDAHVDAMMPNDSGSDVGIEDDAAIDAGQKVDADAPEDAATKMDGGPADAAFACSTNDDCSGQLCNRRTHQCQTECSSDTLC